MVGVAIDVECVVVWFLVRLKFLVVNVHSNLQNVHNFLVGGRSATTR